MLNKEQTLSQIRKSQGLTLQPSLQEIAEGEKDPNHPTWICLGCGIAGNSNMARACIECGERRPPLQAV